MRTTEHESSTNGLFIKKNTTDQIVSLCLWEKTFTTEELLSGIRTWTTWLKLLTKDTQIISSSIQLHLITSLKSKRIQSLGLLKQMMGFLIQTVLTHTGQGISQVELPQKVSFEIFLDLQNFIVKLLLNKFSDSRSPHKK